VPNQSVSQEKRALRAIAQQHRAHLHADLHKTAPQALCGFEIPFLSDREPSVISGFFPIRSEIDVRPLLSIIANRGHRTALPVVTGRNDPLQFREWVEGDRFEEGWGGIGEPLASAPLVRPDVLLVPLLQVDAEGYRLGYGAGHYDRTLAVLRRSGRAVAVGTCYAGQRVHSVPREPHDLPLDWLLTEEGITRFAPPPDSAGTGSA